jgi:hypothetical protein
MRFRAISVPLITANKALKFITSGEIGNFFASFLEQLSTIFARQRT